MTSHSQFPAKKNTQVAEEDYDGPKTFIPAKQQQQTASQKVTSCKGYCDITVNMISTRAFCELVEKDKVLRLYNAEPKTPEEAAQQIYKMYKLLSFDSDTGKSNLFNFEAKEQQAQTQTTVQVSQSTAVTTLQVLVDKDKEKIFKEFLARMDLPKSAVIVSQDAKKPDSAFSSIQIASKALFSASARADSMRKFSITYPAIVLQPYSSWSVDDVVEWMDFIQFPPQQDSVDKTLATFVDEDNIKLADKIKKYRFSGVTFEINNSIEKLSQVLKTKIGFKHDGAMDTFLYEAQQLFSSNTKTFPTDKYNLMFTYFKMIRNVKCHNDKNPNRVKMVNEASPSVIQQNLKQYLDPEEVKKELICTILGDDTGVLDPQFVYQIRVKLVITELPPLNIKVVNANVGSFVTKVIAAAKTAYGAITGTDHYGICHTAVSIGRCLIDWNASGLCYIRPVSSGKAVLCADAQFQGRSKINVSGRELDIMLAKVAKEIVKWNGNMEYCNRPELNSQTNIGNCQNFTFAVFDLLGIPNKFTTLVTDYINNVKYYAESKRVFRMNKAFNKKFFGVDAAEVKEFASHEELDDFYRILKKKAEDMGMPFKKNFRAEYDLLKSYDRAFWLNHYQNKNIAQYVPSPKEKGGCPFNPKKVESSPTTSENTPKEAQHSEEKIIMVDTIENYNDDEAFDVDDF